MDLIGDVIDEVCLGVPLDRNGVEVVKCETLGLKEGHDGNTTDADRTSS